MGNIIKFICLVIAIWFTTVNISLASAKQGVPWVNYLIQGLATAMFIFIQFDMWF